MAGIRARSIRNLGIPNMLSIFRLILIPFFVIAFFSLTSGVVAGLILILSALTDIFDGMIARKFNLVTDLGRMLDPLADKLTQAAVLICFVIRNVSLIWIIVLFILKEVLMIAGGARIIKKGREMIPSRWFGKLATVVFYLVMISIILFHPDETATVILICISLAFMLFAFCMYVPIFLKAVSERNADHQEN